MGPYEFDSLIGVLNNILNSNLRQEKLMADIATDLVSLTALVTGIAADVQHVLTLLSTAPNITPDQVAALESQIAALQSVKDQLDAVIVPPAPAPAP